MKLTNLMNIFTVFGNFAVFDEDTTVLINKVFSNCNISMIQEPNNPQNKAGKLLRIVDNQKHMTITLRPFRIDVQMAGLDRSQKQKVIADCMDVYKALAEMFDGSYASRIAYVSNDFTFDDQGENMQTCISHIDIVPFENVPTEMNLRINSVENIQNEDMNVVLSIQNAMIGNNNNPQMGQRRALIVSYDINTLLQNKEERFDLKMLDTYFYDMYDCATNKLQSINNLR